MYLLFWVWICPVSFHFLASLLSSPLPSTILIDNYREAIFRKLVNYPVVVHCIRVGSLRMQYPYQSGPRPSVPDHFPTLIGRYADLSCSTLLSVSWFMFISQIVQFGVYFCRLLVECYIMLWGMGLKYCNFRPFRNSI